VFVEDVAAAFAKALPDPDSVGRAYDLGGPRVYTLRELVEYVGRITGHARPIVGLNDALSSLQARAMGCLPVKLMTHDNYLSMKVDNVCGNAFPFGIAPAALEAEAPSYLGNRTPRARYQHFRAARGNAVTSDQ
jgi:hypothetical protein